MAGAITIINHATVLIQLDGINILTDPIYSRTVSFLFPRLQPAGIRLQDLPPLQVVLVSHSDYDHLNLKTLRLLSHRHRAPLILPAGLGSYGRSAGFGEVVETTVWQSFERDGVRITHVPAKHLSKRRPGDASSSACAGYVIQAGRHTVYFAGDTAYDSFFAEIGKRFTIDVALLPIGAYKPERWFKNLHLHPATALQAFIDLRARHLVPIHWGTFWISDEPMAEPPQLLRAEAEKHGCAEAVHILRNGESLQLM
jgi:L-ascorbate metabolism protein UlaG (beta-lactamase superfamily)